MTTYRDLTRTLANATAAELVALHADAERDAFIRVGALLVAFANNEATALADDAIATYLGRLPVGLAREDDTERLQAALVGVLDGDGEDVDWRLERLGRAEPLDAGRAAGNAAMQAHGVERWARGVGPDACERCQSWAEDGPFPVSTDMLDHPGCSCVPVPDDRGGR